MYVMYKMQDTGPSRPHVHSLSPSLALAPPIVLACCTVHRDQDIHVFPSSTIFKLTSRQNNHTRSRLMQYIPECTTEQDEAVGGLVHVPSRPTRPSVNIPAHAFTVQCASVPQLTAM